MRPSLIGAFTATLLLGYLTIASPAVSQTAPDLSAPSCPSAAAAAALADSARANQASIEKQLLQARAKAKQLRKKLSQAKHSDPHSPKTRALLKKYRKATKRVRGLTKSLDNANAAVQTAEQASEAANRACVAPSGRLTLNVVAPDGVPAAVAIKPDSPGATRAAASKPADGTASHTDLTLPVGAWTIEPEPVVHEGHFYEAPVQRLTVTAQGVSSATVTYAAVPTVTDLQVIGFTADSITLDWNDPAPSSPVAVRALIGTEPPVTPAQGTPVAVSGEQAVATGLVGQTAYSFAVFTQIDGLWRGPLVTTATTAATGSGESATFVAAPATRVIDRNEVVPATTAGGAVRALLPGAVPVPGQSVVLPVSASLPGGFVGRVESVGPDGSAMLRQAGLSAAFDYLDLSVPDVSSAAAGRQPQSHVRAFDVSCEGSSALELEPVRPTLDGSFDASLSTREFLGVPTSLGADIEVEVSVSVTLAVRAAIQVAATCGLELPDLVRQFQVGPVPMLLKLTPVAEVELSAGATVSNLGLTATGGFRGSAHIPLVGLSGGPELDGSVFGNAQPLEPEGSVSAQARLKLGGEIVLGPGAGTSDAGLVAGISGTINPVDATAKVDAADPTCLELDAGLSAGIGLTARVWVDALDYEWDKTLDLVEGTKSYGGPWFVPAGCGFGGYTGFLELVGTAGYAFQWYDGSARGSSGSIDALVQFGVRGGPDNERGVVILRRNGSWSSYGGDCNTSFSSAVTPGVWTPYDFPIQDDGGVRGEFGPMMHFPKVAPATGSYDICGPSGANPFDGMSPYWNVLPPSAHDFLKKSHSLSMWYRWSNPQGGYTIPSVVNEDYSIAMADMCHEVAYSPYNCDWSQYGESGTVSGQHRVRARLTNERDADADGIPDRLDTHPSVADPF